jgi:hypothetical protein
MEKRDILLGLNIAAHFPQDEMALGEGESCSVNARPFIRAIMGEYD